MRLMLLSVLMRASAGSASSFAGIAGVPSRSVNFGCWTFAEHWCLEAFTSFCLLFENLSVDEEE